MGEEKKGPKPGIKTTEFWLSTVAVLLGVVITILPAEGEAAKIVGAVLAGLGAMGYGVSRGLAKKAPLILLLILPLAIAGCYTGYIKASEVTDTWDDVRTVHDQLVEKGTVTVKLPDGTKKEVSPAEMTELEKKVYLGNTAAFQVPIDAALKDD